MKKIRKAAGEGGAESKVLPVSMKNLQVFNQSRRLTGEKRRRTVVDATHGLTQLTIGGVESP